MPQRIRVLDRLVSEKIAAGEVVENPSSVVKELIENSIDAGATTITIDIERGGKALIRVVDNGEGIQKEDVEKAFVRHATSKISSAEDLESLSSLGFRGEALAAIAAVSMVSLTTRTRNSIEGTLYSIGRDRDITQGETGCAEGTSIQVRHLFYNTPARLEYLKGDSHEASAVNDIVARLALARTDISFKLTSNGRVMLNTPGNGRLPDTIIAVYGRETLENLFPIKCNDYGFEITGYISKPHGSRSNRSFQSFYVNGRYVRSKAVSKALEDAYKTLIMVNRYPMAVLYFTLDTGTIDVNVHPSKLEIKFREEARITSSIYNCVRSALEKGRWVARGSKVGYKSFAKPFTMHSQVTLPQYIKTDRAEMPPEELAQNHRLSEETIEYNRIEMDNNIEGGSQKLPQMKIVGQFLSTFILAEGEECVYIIDQHAAHERIMYEKLTLDMQKGSMASQKLLEPLVVDMNPMELETLRTNKEMLTNMGFMLDEFGVNSIVVRAVPVFFGIPQSKEFLLDLITRLFRQKESRQYELKQDEIIKMACKKAVKANQRLSQREMESLIVQLGSAKMPFTCPHGRPVLTSLTRYELEKMFKRIV